MLNRILQRATRQPELKAEPQPTPGRLRAESFYDPPSDMRQEQQISLYAKLSWIQIAVSISSQTCAATPYSVRSVGRDDPKPIKGHPFLDLLARPNPTQSRFEFLEATFSWRKASGNCYWWLNRPNEETPPAEIWIIPTSKMQPVPDGKMGIKGYLYDYGAAQPMPLEPWEVVHFKTFNPNDRYVGLSPIQSLMLDALGDIASQQYNANFYSKDNAKSAGILAFEDYIEEDNWKRLKDDWSEQHGGTKQNRVMRLRGVGKGVTWIPTQLTRVELEYLEQRRFTKEQIYDLFAPGLSSILAVNATEANSTAGKDTFLGMCVYPQHVAVSEKIDSDILPSYGEGLDGEFDDVRRVDTAQELMEQAEYAKYHTVDEVRAKYYGDPPLPPDERTATQGPKPEPQPMMTPPQEALVQAGKALDLRRWHTKTIKALVAGRSVDVSFDPDYLNDDEAMRIRAGLKRAASAEDLAALFGGGL